MAASVQRLFLTVPWVGLQCVNMHFLVILTYFMKVSACRSMLVLPSSSKIQLLVLMLLLQIARVLHTVNSEIFASLSFSRITLKEIFATLKIRELEMIYLHQLMTEHFRHFAMVLFS